MVDVNLFTSGTPNEKPWLNLVSNSLTTNLVTAESFDVKTIEANSFTLVNQSSPPPNPAVGSVTLYTDGTGVINTVNNMGVTVPYCRITGFQMVGNIDMNGNNLENVQVLSGSSNTRLANNIVSNSTGSVAGNIPSFTDTTGVIEQDSGISSSNLLLADGSVPMTGNLTLSNNNILEGGVIETVQVKASNNVFVNNFGVSFSNFQQTAQVTILNTAALTSITTGAGNIGSLTFPTSNNGQWMQIYVPFQSESTGSPTLTFSLILNTVSECSVTFSPANALTQGLLRVLLMVGPDYLNIFMEQLLSGISNVCSFFRATYVPASSNTFDIAAQWSAASSSNVVGVTSVQMLTNGFNSATPPSPLEFKENVLRTSSTPAPKIISKEDRSLSPAREWEQVEMKTPKANKKSK